MGRAILVFVGILGGLAIVLAGALSDTPQSLLKSAVAAGGAARVRGGRRYGRPHQCDVRVGWRAPLGPTRREPVTIWASGKADRLPWESPPFAQDRRSPPRTTWAQGRARERQTRRSPPPEPSQDRGRKAATVSQLTVRSCSWAVLGIRTRPFRTSQAACPRVEEDAFAPLSTVTTARGPGRWSRPRSH
jgi:hypothetical protein